LRIVAVISGETLARKHMKAISYLRVSGKGQIDGDGFPRQREAIQRWAKSNHYEIVDEFRDGGISGTSELTDRPGLSALFERVLSNGVRVVVVEKADRLARDLVVGELILRELRGAGVAVIEAENGNDLSSGDDSNPTATLIRQVLGAVAQFEKTALVGKLRAARARQRNATGRCEGRKPYGFREGEAEVIAEIRQLRRKRKGLEPASFAKIAATLNKNGRPTRTGKPWHSETVRQIWLRRNATR
jgi:DNA invertase Pin-like site-specific DNA recombinase